MDETKLESVADRCRRFVVNAGNASGVTPGNLATYVEGYRLLGEDERFRVNVLVCKASDIAFAAINDEFRFWPRKVAPESAASMNPINEVK